MNQKVAVLERPGYVLFNNAWLPRGKSVTYTITYNGNDQGDALRRMLRHNDESHIAEVIKHVSWVNTGYYSVDSVMTVRSSGFRKEFHYSITRRLDSGVVVVGDMDIDMSRELVVKGLAKQITSWLKEICFGCSTMVVK